MNYKLKGDTTYLRTGCSRIAYKSIGNRTYVSDLKYDFFKLKKDAEWDARSKRRVEKLTKYNSPSYKMSKIVVLKEKGGFMTWTEL